MASLSSSSFSSSPSSLSHFCIKSKPISSITSLYIRPQSHSSSFYRLLNAVLKNKFNAFQAHLKRYPHHANLLHPQTHQPFIFCIFDIPQHPSMSTIPNDVSSFLLYLLSHFLEQIYTARDIHCKNSILMTAIQHKNIEAIQCILAHATPPIKDFLLGIKNHSCQCPLTLACMVGDVEIVKLLVKAGSNIHLTDELGNTPLHYAKSYNHYSLVSYLIANGGNFMARNKKQWSVLDYAYSFEMQSFFEDAMKTWMHDFTEDWPSPILEKNELEFNDLHTDTVPKDMLF